MRSKKRSLQNSIFLGWLKFYLKRFQDTFQLSLIYAPTFDSVKGGGAYYLLLVHLSISHMYAISGISHKLAELGQLIIDDD